MFGYFEIKCPKCTMLQKILLDLNLNPTTRSCLICEIDFNVMIVNENRT